MLSPKKAVILLSPLFAFSPATAQIAGAPIIVSGTCDNKSGVTIDDSDTSGFDCDTAVVTRADRGTVLIQFTDKKGDDGRVLGFAGTIEGKQGFGADPVQMLGVERLYLAGGADPVRVSQGSCIMNWSGLQRTGGRLRSITCGARGEAEGADIKALVQLVVRP